MILRQRCNTVQVNISRIEYSNYENPRRIITSMAMQINNHRYENTYFNLPIRNIKSNTVPAKYNVMSFRRFSTRNNGNVNAV